MAEKIELIAKDGKKLKGHLYTAMNPRGWVVYLHMMPATKESWKELAEFLQGEGYSGIAIDLRGHGESEGGPEEFFSFSQEEHRASILDLEAAIAYLLGQGAVRETIALVGASIGANLALVHMGAHPETKRGVLFSPGLNYRGIETAESVKNLAAGQRVLFIASRDDGNNADQNLLLYEAVPPEVAKEIKVYDAGGHGTDILKAHEELARAILRFLQ
jgi:dienelactone hydrolase